MKGYKSNKTEARRFKVSRCGLNGDNWLTIKNRDDCMWLYPKDIVLIPKGKVGAQPSSKVDVELKYG
jgi:hypothetical protein